MLNVQKTEKLLVGIDIGSTTTKIAAVRPENGEMVYSAYERHRARQVKTAGDMMERLAENVAVRRIYHKAGTAIELGGQDAKIIFFEQDKDTGELKVYDMRMNGSCAGGTGAFIDEIATILKVPVEQFNALAEEGSLVYDISGRCGVYAKTDIQPLLNQGVSKKDLALSAFHAIAKQTIGGLAQGLTIQKPVVFEGGPLTFNPALIRVFRERLGLTEEETLVPKRPEMMIAYGAAISLLEALEEDTREYSPQEILSRLREIQNKPAEALEQKGRPFFETEQEKEEFYSRHKIRNIDFVKPAPGTITKAYLGIDSGSTTTKMVLLGEDEKDAGFLLFFNPLAACQTMWWAEEFPNG